MLSSIVLIICRISMKKKETLNFRVSAEFKRRIIEEANKQRRSLTNYIETTLMEVWTCVEVNSRFRPYASLLRVRVWKSQPELSVGHPTDKIFESCSFLRCPAGVFRNQGRAPEGTVADGRSIQHITGGCRRHRRNPTRLKTNLT
jgi:hypothetical protein